MSSLFSTAFNLQNQFRVWGESEQKKAADDSGLALCANGYVNRIKGTQIGGMGETILYWKIDVIKLSNYF